MWSIVVAFAAAARAALRARQDLALENLALRQQFAVLQRQVNRPRLRPVERWLWTWLARRWPRWKQALVLVRPETVLGWHRRGFQFFWSWKSRRRRPGRPPGDGEIRALVRRMAEANPLWGAPRIHDEFLKLGFQISQSTVSRWMPRRRKPPSQTWRTFLANHLRDLVAIDFFTVPTVTFRILFGFVVLSLERRRALHFNVTDSPMSAWTTQQIVEAFPEDQAPRFLLRDRDSIYSRAFRDRVQGMGIEEVLTAPRSPWQNAYVERFIGTLRRT
jgi:transposase InsO family protein